MRKQAFSLLELIVVMAIMAMLAMLAIYGFVSFRTIVQTRQSINEVISVTKETRDLAKNNVLLKGANTDAYEYAYALSFENNQIRRYICQRAKGTVDTTWTCPATGTTIANLKSSIFSSINYQYTPGISCYDVIFENLTGDIKTKTQPVVGTPWTGFADADCTLSLFATQQQQTKYVINFKGVSNTFGLANE